MSFSIALFYSWNKYLLHSIYKRDMLSVMEPNYFASYVHYTKIMYLWFSSEY